MITKLRKECPWDKKQTPQTFKSYLIEEAYELLEAVDKETPQAIKEELGDMFFQIIFLANLYQEKGLFTLAEVLEGITTKMVTRHPHVFDNETVSSEQDQRQKWNQLKSQEKDACSLADLLANVPRNLPGLRRAQRVSERAANNGFEWQNIQGALTKLDEEVDEIKEAVKSGNKTAISEEIGDALFVLVNIGRLTQLNAEEALHGATDKFIHRFSLLEEKAVQQDKKIADFTYDQLLALWAEVKKMN
nr:nucleoside triphosphate pyrophosphohydrolase [Desulfobulbaceae bacterium]